MHSRSHGIKREARGSLIEVYVVVGHGNYFLYLIVLVSTIA